MIARASVVVVLSSRNREIFFAQPRTTGLRGITAPSPPQTSARPFPKARLYGLGPYSSADLSSAAIISFLTNIARIGLLPCRSYSRAYRFRHSIGLAHQDILWSIIRSTVKTNSLYVRQRILRFRSGICGEHRFHRTNNMYYMLTDKILGMGGSKSPHWNGAFSFHPLISHPVNYEESFLRKMLWQEAGGGSCFF